MASSSFTVLQPFPTRSALSFVGEYRNTLIFVPISTRIFRIPHGRGRGAFCAAGTEFDHGRSACRKPTALVNSYHVSRRRIPQEPLCCAVRDSAFPTHVLRVFVADSALVLGLDNQSSRRRPLVIPSRRPVLHHNPCVTHLTYGHNGYLSQYHQASRPWALKHCQMLAIIAEEAMTAVSHPNGAAGTFAVPAVPESPHGCWKLSNSLRDQCSCKGTLVGNFPSRNAPTRLVPGFVCLLV
jgi:hypothetical protein